MQVKTILFLMIFALSVLISGCGNSGSEPATEVALGNARAVDPYLMNATFTEYDAEGKELQTSDKPSAKNGTFWFQIPLTVGSTVNMDTTANISHVLYDNTQLAYNGPQLQRKVTRAFSEDEEFIISPITTLAALLMDKAEAAGSPITEDDAIDQIVSLLTASGIEGVTADNLFKNPMGVFADGQEITEDMTDAEIAAIQATLDQTLVQANMAVAVALKSIGALPNDSALDVPGEGENFDDSTDNAFDTVLAEAVKTLQKYMEDETQSIDARLKQGLIASSDIIETVIGADDFSSATVDKKTKDAVKRAQDLIEVLEPLVAAAEEQQQNEVVIITEDNQVVTKNYQALFDAAFPAAMALVNPTISGAISLAAPADLVKLANKFDNAKSIYAEDRAKYDEAVAKYDAAFDKYHEDYLVWEAAGSDPATEPTLPAPVTYVPISVSQADLDALNFYYAFSRVMLLANPLSDSNPDNGLQTLGDVLDELEVDNATRNMENFGTENCVPDPLGGPTETCSSTVFIENADGSTTAPANTPTGAELQAMLYQSVAQELKTAVKALSDVSNSFQMLQTVDGDFADTDFDYADVLFIKTYANALLFQIHMQQGLVINVDIKELAETNNMTVEEFLAANPEILATKDAVALEKAREYATLALKGLSLAIDIVKDEELTDAFQDDDLVSFQYDTAAEVDEMQLDIEHALDALYTGYEETHYDVVEADGTYHSEAGIILNFSKLFNGMVSLNSLLPAYTGNKPGMFPDKTMGGMVLYDLDLNKDGNKNGSPDEIESLFEDVYNIDGAYVQYRGTEGYSDPMMGTVPTFYEPRGWVSLSRNFSPIDPSEISSGGLYYNNAPVDILSMNSGYGNYYIYDCLQASCTERWYEEAGISISEFASPPQAGDYTYEITLYDGTTLEKTVHYQGEIELPIIDSNIGGIMHQPDGIEFYWENPTSAANWNQVDQIRVMIHESMSSGTEIIVKVAPTHDWVLVPYSVLYNAGLDPYSTSLYWSTQTRAYDGNGTQYARGLSNGRPVN